MLFEDTYRTISNSTESSFLDRGSKFWGFAFPIRDETALKAYLAGLRKIHAKANHHCWAMRLTIDRSVFRINDDGEPSGTAGRPILNTLLSKDLTNLAVVVVRYFGGTLLGVPGLINAYRTAAEQTLKQAVIIERTINDVYTLSFSYLQMNEVMRLIKESQLTVISQSLDMNCRIVVAIRKTLVNQTLSKLSQISGATAKFEYSR